MYNPSLFAAAMLLALAGPLLALRYLRPILMRVLGQLCNASDSAAEFWMRSAYLLAASGSGILMLIWGNFSADADPVQVLRQSLLLVLGGVFLSVALIARNVWRQVLALLETQRASRAVQGILQDTWQDALPPLAPTPAAPRPLNPTTKEQA